MEGVGRGLAKAAVEWSESSGGDGMAGAKVGGGESEWQGLEECGCRKISRDMKSSSLVIVIGFVSVYYSACSTVLYCTLPYSNVQYSTGLPFTLQNSTVQYYKLH